MERKDNSNGNIPGSLSASINSTKQSLTAPTHAQQNAKPRTASTRSRSVSASVSAQGPRTSHNLVSASKAMPEWVDLQVEKFNYKHAFEDDSKIPLSRKVAAWKRPVDVFVPHTKETKQDKEAKEQKEKERESKDNTHHHPPFCVVSPIIPLSASSASIARSPSPSSSSSSTYPHRVVLQADPSHAKLEVPAEQPPVEQYQREHFLNTECFSRLVNGAIIPQQNSSSPSPSPLPPSLSPLPPSLHDDEHPRAVSSKGNREKKDEEKERDRDREREREESEDETKQDEDPEVIQQQMFQLQVNHIRQQLQHPVDTRWMTSLFSVMLQNETKIGEGNFLWELIYPKGKDGRPVYNPSGKYCVKLFVLGSWRKITIDDRIPLDENNSIMFIQSNTVLELWPLLLTKALFKVATLMQVYNACEADYLYWLGGWVPQIEPIIEEPTWTILNNLQECKQVMLCASVAPLSLDNIHDSVDSIKSALQQGLRSGQMYLIDNISSNTNTTTNTITKTIHLKTIQPPRIVISRPLSSSPAGRLVSRPSSAAQINSEEHPLMGADIWIAYEDFCLYFKTMMIYHSPDYPSNAVIQALGDVPANYPPLLYTESEVPTHLAIHITISSSPKSESEEDAVTLTLERYHWTTIGSNPDAPLISLKTKIGLCTLVWIPAGRNVYRILLNGKGMGGYQVKFSSPSNLQIGDYLKILPKLALEVIEYEPVYKTSDSGVWSLWFKYIVQAQEEGVWSWQIVPPDYTTQVSTSSSSAPTSSSPTLHTSASSHAIASATSAHASSQNAMNACVSSNAYPYVRLRVIDNDSLEEFPAVLGCTPPRRFAPNELGYTIMGELKSPIKVPSSKCKLRVISSHPLFTVENEVTRCVHEYEEAFIPTQTVPLFRDVLRVKEKAQVAIHVGVPPSNGNVYLKLQIFDKGAEIYSTEGKRSCIIPVFYLYPTQKKEEEYHKYILQATVVRYIPSSDETPRTRVKSTRVRSSKKKERKGERAQSREVVREEDEFVWQLRIISSVAVDVKKDTEREDRHATIKASWETTSPGRAAKAKVSRDKFVHSLSLVPSSFDLEGKETGPKYVKTSSLPPAMVRIRRTGNEDEVMEVDQLIARTCPPPPTPPSLPSSPNLYSKNNFVSPASSSVSSKSTITRVRSNPSNIAASVSPLARVSSKNILSSSPPENNNNNINNINNISNSSENLSPPLPPISPMPISNTTPSISFTNNDAQITNPNARLRTDNDVAEANSKMATEQKEFVDWHLATVDRCKANLQDVNQSRDSVLGYLESCRIEVKKRNLTHAERREQYNAKCFPHVSFQTTPEKDHQQSSQPKEKIKRKNSRINKA